MRHEPEEVLNTLQRARAILTTRGWAKGRRERPNGQVCTRGALGLAIDKDPYLWHHPLMRDCERAMGFRFWKRAVPWNDSGRRTFSEVLRRFDNAIAALDKTVQGARLGCVKKAMQSMMEPPYEISIIETEEEKECAPTPDSKSSAGKDAMQITGWSSE